MKTKPLAVFIALVLFEGIFAAIILLVMPFDSSRGHLLNYQAIRLGLEILVVPALFGLGFLLIRFLRNAQFARAVVSFLDEKMTGKTRRLFFVQGALLVLSLFLVECSLLTYLAFPVPLRPIFIWAALTCFEAWLGLRLMYSAAYRERPSAGIVLKTKWREWLPVQRKTLGFLAVIGLLNFLAFAPLNYLRDKNTHFYMHPDEDVIYPDVVKVLVWQGSFDATVHNILDGWQWWYGYPYLPISAAVLIIPRLLFGETFGQQVQLNILLLRQFISVLPMTLALLLLVYLVTRFKNTLFSIGMFIFLLFIPGIVKFNFHFWHPDGLILLLIVLTFYFLESDRLRFRSNFYLAAVTCALALAIKLWGAYFVLAIAGYLAAGWFRKALTFKKTILAGLAFLLMMIATIAISSPTLLVPYVTRSALEGWQLQQSALLQGYSEPDPEGVYRTGLANWLRYFDLYYMKNSIFYLSVAAVIGGSFWGARKYMNRIILAWCVPTAFFLINFVSMKSNHYMIPLMLPLYGGLFLLPFMGQQTNGSKVSSSQPKPVIQKLLWGVLIVAAGSQFVFNLANIVTSHAVGINDFISSLH